MNHKKNNLIKVLHAPMNISGMPWALAQAEIKMGLDSKVMTYRTQFQKYNYDYNLEWEKKNKFNQIYSSSKFFLKNRNKFDIFHFTYGTSILNFKFLKKMGIYMADLPFYSKNKKLIFTYNGCDARQKYPTMNRVDFSACHESDCYNGKCTHKVDKERENEINVVEKYADHIFAVNPDLFHFLPKEKTTFLPYIMGDSDYKNTKIYEIKKKIKIVHAPTDQGAKGSRYILPVLNLLAKKYNNLEIVLVENMTNVEALEVYNTADIIVDQVLIGWYGGFAVEVMQMGKPVVCFIREEDLCFVDKQMAKDVLETFINVNPFNIYEILAYYIENPDLLKQKSDASLSFVNKWHNHEYVASITKSIYEK